MLIARIDQKPEKNEETSPAKKSANNEENIVGIE